MCGKPSYSGTGRLHARHEQHIRCVLAAKDKQAGRAAIECGRWSSLLYIYISICLVASNIYDICWCFRTILILDFARLICLPPINMEPFDVRGGPGFPEPQVPCWCSGNDPEFWE